MKKVVSILLVMFYFICCFSSCGDSKKPSNIISEDEAIEIIENSVGKDCSCVSNGLEEVEGKYYYVIDLKRNMEKYYTHITYYFVSMDGLQIIEGGYDKNGKPEFFQ